MSPSAESGNPKDQEPGFLTSIVKALLHALKYLSPLGLLERFRSNITPATKEWYVLTSLFLEFIAAINVTKIAGWADG
jgi:hypothetical protein